MGKDSGEIFDDHIKGAARGTSLEVQWLRLLASNAGGAGSIPGQGTKIPHVAWHGQKLKIKKKKKEEEETRLNCLKKKLKIKKKKKGLPWWRSG